MFDTQNEVTNIEKKNALVRKRASILTNCDQTKERDQKAI